MSIPQRHAPTGKPIVIGLLWHSVNSDNFGVGALTLAHIAILEEVAKRHGVAVQFDVLGWFDARAPYAVAPNIRAVPIRMRNALFSRDGLFAAIRRCDMVLDIGAGDSFSDIYGLKRFAFLAVSKALVLLARKPLILSPQTIGPFRRPWVREVAQQLMQRCNAVVVRDDASLKAIRAGGGATIVAATDVAFRLPFVRPVVTNERVRVGINVSGLLFNGGYDGRNQFGLNGDYRTLMRSLLAHFTARPECEVHLISHVLSDRFAVEDDYRVAYGLAQEFPAAVLAPPFASPSEAKSYIAGMDFVCGSRMHACIAAFSSGVPVLPLAYSPKFAGLFESLGYHHIADCRSEPADQIVAKVIAAYEDRAALAVAVIASNIRAQERLGAYEAVLDDCLSAVTRAA